MQEEKERKQLLVYIEAWAESEWASQRQKRKLHQIDIEYLAMQHVVYNVI